jgi:hypothetical protein
VSNPLGESADELSEAVRTLNESIGRALGLRDDLDRLIVRSSTTRKMVWIVGVGFVLDILLTIGMIFVTQQSAHNTDRIDNLVQVQHDSALCPLYRLFISSDTPANRERAKAQGQDLAERDRSFAVIRESYKALNCKDR